MDIKDNTKAICKAAGITFDELSNRLNITRQSLHRFLTKNPTTDTVKKIAEALTIPPFILLHPAPLAALERWNASQEEGRQAPGPAVIICPHCNQPIQIRPAALPPLSEKPTARRRPSNDGTPATAQEDKPGQDRTLFE